MQREMSTRGLQKLLVAIAQQAIADLDSGYIDDDIYDARYFLENLPETFIEILRQNPETRGRRKKAA